MPLTAKDIDALFEKKGLKTITLVDSKNQSNTLTLTKDELKFYLGMFDDVEECPLGKIGRF